MQRSLQDKRAQVERTQKAPEQWQPVDLPEVPVLDKVIGKYYQRVVKIKDFSSFSTKMMPATTSTLSCSRQSTQSCCRLRHSHVAIHMFTAGRVMCR